MPVDISIHALGNPIQGNHPPAPQLPVLGGQAGLAEDTNSNDIVIPSPGGVVYLTATAKVRMDLRLALDAAALAPAASGTVLAANLPQMFSLRPGTWKLRTTAYV